MSILCITHFFIDFLTITLHLFGLFLLRNVKASQNFHEIQRYLLIQLSLYELVCGLSFLVEDVIILLIDYNGSSNTVLLAKVKLVLVTIINLPSFILFVTIMLFITIDRFLYVYLNIRYPLVCRLRKIKIIFGVWQMTLVLLALLIIIFHQHASSFNTVAKFMWPIGDVLFLAVSIGTYSYVFMKIRKNRKIDTQISSRVNSEGRNELQLNCETQFSRDIVRKNSLMKPFFMLGLLILSFSVFIIIPDEVVFWHLLLNLKINEDLNSIMTIVFKLGYFSDAFIYIFLQKEILKRAKTFLVRCRWLTGTVYGKYLYITSNG